MENLLALDESSNYHQTLKKLTKDAKNAADDLQSARFENAADPCDWSLNRVQRAEARFNQAREELLAYQEEAAAAD